MAAQMDFFGGSPANRQSKTPTPDMHGLRPYQVAAVDGITSRLLEDRSTLVVMPTGSGKTRIATEVAIRRAKDRILFLAHRDELLQQGRKRLANDTGELVGLDQAEFFAGDERIVVGSVQTVSMPNRLERFEPHRFDLIIVDEAHHAPAPTYRRVLDYFAEAKVIGVTATPDRADEKAMGQVFDSVAFLYEIEDAIRDGWLCDVACTRIHVAGLDVSTVRTTAGDLNQGELDAVMKVEGVLQGIADATLREACDRKTLIFTTSVENAHRLAEIMCRHRPGCALAVDGNTELGERRKILAGHQRKDFQFLVNVGIATEGYDDPTIACVAIARPTKSRALYAQMAGRGLRIAAGKRDCLLLDFVGNSGRHKLASAVDILGGNYSEEEAEAAREIVDRTPGIGARAAIDQAKAKLEQEKREAEEAVRRAAVRAKAIYTKHPVDPFAALHMDVSHERDIARRFGGKPPSEKQINLLAKFKIPLPDGCTSQLASRLIGKAIDRRNKKLASFGQITCLQRHGGIDATEMPFTVASRVIDALAKQSWRPLSSETLDRLTGTDF